MNTLEKIKKIIADQLNISLDAIKPSTSLNDLGADPLDKMEIVMRIETLLSIEISDEAAEELDTIEDLLQYIKTLQG